MLTSHFGRLRFGLLVLVAAFLGTSATIWAAGDNQGDNGRRTHQVTVPAEDRFAPFAVTIPAGDTVRWVNNDADDHTVVSDDAFNTAGHQGFDQILATGRSLKLRFAHPGTFVYYCRFHAQLDAFHQPVAPGPEGGIQDANGNFGTPMSGIVTVLPNNGEQGR
jgi:plastocyanin